MAHEALGGSVALVTGASRGLGRAIAEHLGRLGADMGMIQRGRAEETVATLRALGRRVALRRVDLAEPELAARATHELAVELGRLDICVCNAGAIHREPALDVSLTDWNRVMAVNLTSTFAVARAAARAMVDQGTGGSIVLIASVLAFQGGVNVSSYAATKAGVVNLAHALANEWAPLGVRVNAVAPGYLENDQTAPLRADPVRKAGIDARIPAGRWGTEEDVLPAVAFLATNAGSYMNGHTLIVDGGWLGR